jgi:hypothetical protein
MATQETKARAVIIAPDGAECEIYFECAGCGRLCIWTLTDNGRCPKCYHDCFKIRVCRPPRLSPGGPRRARR